MPQMTNMFDIAFDNSSDVNEDGTGIVTLEDGSATAIVTVIATLPHGKQNMNWTLNFTTALDTTNNVIDATIGGTRTSPSNVAYIDKITIGDTVSVKDSSFDGLTANIVLAAGTAPDATFDFAFSYVHTMPQMTNMFDIAFDSSSDVNEDGTGTVTLEDGSATAIVTVIATLPHGKQNMNWTLNFTTASGGSSGGGNKNTIPVEIFGNLWGEVNIGINQFIFRDCKVLDYNWADDNTLNVWVSDATADNGTLSIRYNTIHSDGTDIDIPSPYTVQLEGGKATVQYHITPKGPYNTAQNAHAAHTITVKITNKGLTLPALAEGVAVEADASVKLGEAYTVNLDSIFSDAESDPMTYSVNIDGEGAVSADAQYRYTAAVVGEYKLVFKAYDGMNWSTATYTVNLSVTDDTEPYTFTAKVPDAITPTFSVTKGFREDGTDWAGTALVATKGASKDGWTSYTVTVPGSTTWVSVRGTDGTNDWGGMAFAVEKDAVITLRQVKAIINSKIVLDNEESYPTAEQAVFKVEYADEISTRYAVSGGSFNDETGYLGYRFLLVAADNSLSYTYYAEPLGEVAKHYSTNVGVTKTITTDSASVVTTTLPLGTMSGFSITAPVDAKVQMFTQTPGNYYGASEIPVFDTKENGDGTKTVTFNGTGTGTATYRVSMEGEITKAGYVSGDGVTISWEGDDRGPKYRRTYDFSEDGYYQRADDSVLVNVNYRNNLLLDVGETHTLRSYRIWQIINNDTQNVLIEPDFHVNILSGDDVISLSEYPDYHGNGTGNRMNITALKEGTAILEVTYDAIEIMEREVGGGEISGMGGLTFNACDPTRTALIVVQVGAEDTDINFGIVNNGGNAWDSEFDTVYFLGDQGQLELNPKVGSGTIEEVAVSNNKGASWTTLEGNNGTYIANILPGNNIIRITKGDGTVSYQIVRGDRIAYTVAELTEFSGETTADGDGIIEAGEKVAISFTGQHNPFGKMAGIYNPWNWHTRYEFESTTLKGAAGMYTYAHYSQVFLTIPEDAQPGEVYTLTNGYTELGTAFGSGGGGHRNAGDVVPPSMDAPDSVPGAFNIFPDLTITVGSKADSVDKPVAVESVTLDATATVKAGKTIRLTPQITPYNATIKAEAWTSSDESIATVVDGYVSGVKEGTATITVTIDGKSASCVVTVEEADAEGELDFGIPKKDILGYVTVSFEDNGKRVEGEDIKAAYKEPRGVIIPATKVPFCAYDTIASVTLRLLEAKGYIVSYSGTEFGGFYLSEINGFGEFDAGAGSGWMITWNDWFINKGASEFTVKDGDVVKWQYTCQLGADIGDDSFYGDVIKVINLIDAIGDNITAESGNKIMAAREAYDKLSDTDKQRVSNYKKLTDAEEAAKKLATEADKAAATAVDELITAIGGVTKDKTDEIEAARKAYDKLTDLQKLLVKNLDTLLTAESVLKTLLAASAEDVYKATGDYLVGLAKKFDLTVAAEGGEWIVVGLERAGRDTPNVTAYYRNVLQYIEKNINDKEQLHSTKSTDNSRVILALTAAGYDVTNVGGHNLLMGLTDMSYVKKQGVNGPIWALIAFDSHNYEIPTNAKATEQVSRDALIDYILGKQLSDGGWTLSGSVADADMTGMALAALAPYYKNNDKVKAAVDKALDTLSKMQDSDGSFGSIDGACTESCAQVIVALTALGIDPEKDGRFIKNGISVVDALRTFYVEGGGFKHVADGKLNGMATEQGYYALAAYFRLLDKKTSLYNMSDVTIKTAVTVVEDLIDAIGEVTYDTECKSRIDAAREAYNALSSADKAKVKNYKKLTAAEATYAQLERDHKAAQRVIDLIDSIGYVTLSSENKILRARAAYNSLTYAQKKLVYNYSTLLYAEERLEELKIEQVEDLIDAIGTVTLDSKAKIERARAAYNALSNAAQKKVSNLNVLVAAEKAYDKLVKEAKEEEAAKRVNEVTSQIESISEDATVEELLDAILAFDTLTEAEKTASGKAEAVEALKKQIAEMIQTDVKTGISVSDVEWNIQLVVEKEQSAVQTGALQEKLGNNTLLGLWDIYLKDIILNQEVQPDGTVLVKIPLKLLGDYSGFDGLAVVHYADDGTVEYLSSEIAEECVTFHATDFSYYAVVGYMGDSPLDGMMNDEANDTVVMPWIITGCCAVVLLGVVLFLNGKSKKQKVGKHAE